jgi:hypothetical protein
VPPPYDVVHPIKPDCVILIFGIQSSRALTDENYLAIFLRLLIENHEEFRDNRARIRRLCLLCHRKHLSVRSVAEFCFHLLRKVASSTELFLRAGVHERVWWCCVRRWVSATLTNDVLRKVSRLYEVGPVLLAYETLSQLPVRYTHLGCDIGGGDNEQVAHCVIEVRWELCKWVCLCASGIVELTIGCDRI